MSGKTGMKSAFKGRSFGKTKRRSTDEEKGQAEPIAGGVIYHQGYKLGVGGKFNKKLGRMYATLTAKSITEVLNSAAIHTQAFFDISMSSNSPLADMLIQARTQAELLTGAAFSGGSLGNTTKLYMQSVSTESIITNLTAHAVNVEIYFYRARRDCPFLPSDVINDSNTATIADFANYASSGITGAIAGDVNNVGYLPTDNTLFNYCFKIIKTKKFILAGGENINLNTHCLYNKMWNPAISAGASGSVSWKGFTHGFLVRYYGMPSKLSTSANLAYGAVELGCLSRKSYKFKPALSWTRPSVQFKDLTGPFTGSEKFVDEQVGQVFTAGTGLSSGLVV
jgi:hypothetical protein